MRIIVLLFLATLPFGCKEQNDNWKKFDNNKIKFQSSNFYFELKYLGKDTSKIEAVSFTDSLHLFRVKSNRHIDSSRKSILLNQNLKKNVSTIFIVFNPDCEFCQHETIDLLKNITRFKNTQIVMVSYMSYDMLKQFYKRYQIANYPIITMGRDENFFFLKFFKIRILPSTFVYDKNGNFKKAFKQRVDMDPLLEEL